MVFFLDRCGRAAFFASGNKKGPREAPCAPPAFGWRSATPGDAPGYDGDKEFGNNITHLIARTSQRLREHNRHRPNVKARSSFRLSLHTLAGFLPLGECENAAPAQKSVIGQRRVPD